MAFLIKNTNTQRTAGVAGNGQAIVNQWIQVNRPSALLPATTTDILYKVRGGRVWVHALVATATILFTATDPVLSVNCSAFTTTGETVVMGTTIVIATTVSLANLEKGGMAFAEGDGTALVKYVAGGVTAFNGAMATTTGGFMAGTHPTMGPSSEIYITTGATNTTATMTWDLWYQPLDPGAYVVALATGTVAI